MKRSRLAGITAVVLATAAPVVAVVLWLAGQEVRRETQPVGGEATRSERSRQAPDGPHKDLFVANCGACHPPKMTFRKPLSSAAWRETIDRMVATHGLEMPAADIEPVLEYLLASKP